jgi:formate hydrogenlyase subunit 3/multisubunit Na+/H+ antiporter MnhD subunit
MPLLPVLTIVLLLLGAVGILALSFFSRARPYTRYIALTVLSFTAVSVFLTRWLSPAVIVPSLWQPSLLFGGTLAFRFDALVQPLALALALVNCSAVLVDLSREPNPRPQLTAALLALLAAAFATLWSANLVTMLICWAIYDWFQAVGQVAAGRSARTVIRGLILSSLATLLLWGGVLLSEERVDSGLWTLMTLDEAQVLLWALAGMLRLWMYPFHLLAPDDWDTAPVLAAPLFLGYTVGWGLWLRLASLDGDFLLNAPLLLVAAAVAVALGAFLAWSCRTSRCVLQWVGMAVAGEVLLAAGLAGEGAVAVLVVGSVAWAMSMALLFLGNGLSEGLTPGSLLWSIPSLIGILTLLGTPFTLGFVAEATLLGGVTDGEHPWLWGVAFAGNLFLLPALVRWLFSSDSPLAVAEARRRWQLVPCGIGLGLSALLLVVAGLYPPLFVSHVAVPSLGALLAMPGPKGWLLWAVPLAVGGVFAWQEGGLLRRVVLLRSAVHDLLRLEWLYDILMGALDRGLSALRAADEVVGGAGALLWSLLLFLLLVLVWSGE